MLALALLAVLILVIPAAAAFRLHGHGFRFRTPPRVRPDHRFTPGRSSIFTSGARIGLYQTSRIHIEVDRGWMSIGVLVTTWIERYHVTGVRSFRSLLRTGFMFDTDDGRYDGVILWTLRPDRLRATLALYHWPVP